MLSYQIHLNKNGDPMKYIKNFFEQFIILIQFMTRIPIPLKISYSEKKFGKSIKFFPLVGLIIGLILYFANFLIIVYLKNIFYMLYYLYKRIKLKI